MARTAGGRPDVGEGPDEAVSRDVAVKVSAALEGLPHDVTVHLYTKKGENDAFNEAARAVVGLFVGLSKRIRLEERRLDGPAKKAGIERSPTLVFEPGRYNIRWLGAPAGNEAQSLFQALILLGTRQSGLSKQSLKVFRKIDTPRRIRMFVSVTCPFCPTQVVNGLRAAVERPDLVSLEIVDISTNPDLALKYSAQSVPQTFANDVNISNGAQPEELFVASLEKMEKQVYFIPDIDAEVVETDLVIVGGGPAGLTAGIYAARSGLEACIVERGALGGQVATTPVVENYTGLTMVGGKTLVDFMVTHALQYVPIFQSEEVMDIERGERFTVTTNRRRFFTRAVLLATGAKYRHLDAPGESRLGGLGVSYCATCDAPLFKDRQVLVVGGGDSALTEALYLQGVGARPTLVHRRDRFSAQAQLSEQIAASGIPVLWNAEVKEIRGERKVEEVLLRDTKTGEEKAVKADGVFVAIGLDPEVALARKLGIELTKEGFIKRDGRHRTSVPGIYSAGDVEGGFRQIVTAVGQGAEAALSIHEDLRGSRRGSKDMAGGAGKAGR